MLELIPELNHHSASSVNQFLNNRGGWFQSKFLGKKFQGSKYTARGTAVEAGINHWLEKSESDATVESVKHAIEVWNKEIKDMGLDAASELEFKQSIAPMVNVGIESVKEKYLEKHRRNPVQQYKISVDVPGCKRPAIGYIDWIFPDRLVVDNKTTGKTPSSLSQDYIVQGAVYNKATGLPVEFHYEVALKTPKCVVIPVTEKQVELGWRIFCRAARAIEAVFDNMLDGDLMKNLFLPNPDSCWDDKEREELMKEFGF